MERGPTQKRLAGRERGQSAAGSLGGCGDGAGGEIAK